MRHEHIRHKRSRHRRGVAVAAWVLERLSTGVDGALAGDLLEELEAGRSVAWFWRQVVCAIAANAIAVSRMYAVPLVFSAGWSLLYPLWLAVGGSGLTHRIVEGAAAFAWPYSALMEPLLAILPLMLFLWVGLLVYLSLPLPFDRFAKLPVLRLLAGLSVGFNVLLMASALLLHPAGPHGMAFLDLMAENFYTHARLAIVGAPLVLSLYASIVCVRPRTRRRQPTAR